MPYRNFFLLKNSISEHIAKSVFFYKHDGFVVIFQHNKGAIASVALDSWLLRRKSGKCDKVWFAFIGCFVINLAIFLTPRVIFILIDKTRNYLKFTVDYFLTQSLAIILKRSSCYLLSTCFTNSLIFREVKVATNNNSKDYQPNKSLISCRFFLFHKFY